MTILRQRMLEDMQLGGLAKRTQDAYLQAVRQLAKHYYKSPDELGEEDLREYFLYMKNVKQVSRSTLTVHLCGIRFLYEQTLGQEWPLFENIHPPKEEKLPVVLSVGEVERILKQVRRIYYRTCLGLIYACGLRVSEGVGMQVKDIDGDRNQVCVRGGKGNAETKFLSIVMYHYRK